MLVHRFPAGLSLAAVLVANQSTRRTVTRMAVQLGLVIPLAAGPTAALPVAEGQAEGTLTGLAGGMLTYLAPVQVLPEAQTGHPGRSTRIVFCRIVPRHRRGLSRSRR